MSKKVKIWIQDAGIRAIKTFAQSFVSLITVGAALNEVNWPYVLSVSAVAAILSVMTSLAGLPETSLRLDIEGDDEEESDDDYDI